MDSESLELKIKAAANQDCIHIIHSVDYLITEYTVRFRERPNYIIMSYNWIKELLACFDSDKRGGLLSYVRYDPHGLTYKGILVTPDMGSVNAVAVGFLLESTTGEILRKNKEERRADYGENIPENKKY
jgi:hypothetical protein